MILSLLLPTLLGWLFALGGLNFFRKGSWLRKIDLSDLGNSLEKELLSPAFIREKLLTPDNYQKMVPQVESHIDHFLRVRLKEDMPVVGMMIGDRTINQMKGIFLKEMEQLFPEVMEGYLINMKEGSSMKGILTERLHKDNDHFMKELVKPLHHQYAVKIQVLAAGAGFVSGILQVLIYFLFRP